MDLGLDASALALLAAALCLAGVVTGFLAGLLGIGGGGVLVPVLYETFTILGIDEAVRMHLALGTSFAVIVPTAWRSYRSHKARGAVDEAIVRRLVPAVLAGVAIGIGLMSVASGTALKLFWIACALLLAVKMAVGREDWRLGSDPPAGWLFELFGFLIGLASTLMSIGGGMFFVALFTLYGRSLLTAVATSSGFGPVIAVPALAGYVWAGWGVAGLPPASLGYVSVIAAAIVIPMSVLTAPLGVRAAHGLSRRALELAFAAYLTIVAVRFLLTLA